MKRIIPLLLMLILFSGCTVKDYTPELADVFTQNASVSLGDFSFKCEICKNNSFVKVTVLDTNAEGMVMMYNGDTLDFVYEDYNYSISPDNYEKTNVAIVIYQIMESAHSEEAIIKKIDGGYQYKGKIDVGSYALVLGDDNMLKSIVIPQTTMNIVFE